VREEASGVARREAGMDGRRVLATRGGAGKEGEK